MANKDYIFKVSTLVNGKIIENEFDNQDAAIAAYNKLMSETPDQPRKLVRTTGVLPVILGSNNWNEKIMTIENKQLWKRNAKSRLLNAGISEQKVEKLLSGPIEGLQNAVIARNFDWLDSDINVAKIIFYALKDICLATAVKSSTSKEFARVTLNNDFSKGEIFITDTIRKSVSRLEKVAMSLGGDNAIIHVVSVINDPNPDSVDDINWKRRMLEEWEDAVENGLIVSGVTYKPLGHGTNAAKECKSIWCRSDLYDRLNEIFKADTEDGWYTTAAKKIGYLFGLQSSPSKAVGIPFHPEDFAIFSSVKDIMKVNTVHEYLDGSERAIDGEPIEMNRSDGFGFIHIPDQMKAELINRMILRGEDPAEAEEKLNEFIADTSVNSYRCEGMALKGLFLKNVDVHRFLRDNKIKKLPDGRDVNTIAIFVDETVIKTNIGEKGAYKTFADFCKAVGDSCDLGVCVKGHGKDKKNVPYQVLQSFCEASNQSILEMAKPTIKAVNEMHTVDGIAKAMNKEMGKLISMFPELLNVRDVKDRVKTILENNIDEAFGGKLLSACYYAFICPDPIYVLQGWFGLERTGCIDAGEIIIGDNTKLGECAFWRSPVVHPNSIRVLNSVKVKNEFKKYFLSFEWVFIMNCKDDTAMAADADFDGDHASVSFMQAIVQAAKETLAVWDRLVVWETPKTQKKPIGREEILEHFANLTKRNDLGLTVYGLNALLNRIVKCKDPITGEKYTEAVPLSKRGINFKKFAANVLVDAGKHGGATITEPVESAMAANMLQPWAKEYRDAASVHVGKELTTKQIQAEKNKIRKYLDKIARLESLSKKHMVGTLNKLYALYAQRIDRSIEIKDVPKDEFDFHKIIFNPEEKYRGLSGLIRMGTMPITTVDGESMRPDQGLFEALARRVERDRKVWYAQDHKDKEDNSFEEVWRINAIAEVQSFAEAMGRTLEDAYDVITWQMFKYTDDNYDKLDGKMDYFRNNLWTAYWLIFGGMAIDAAMRNTTNN